MSVALRCGLICMGRLIYGFNVSVDGYIADAQGNIPTAVGGGTPFFPTLPAWISLRLLENRTFPGGTVLLRYEAKHD